MSPEIRQSERDQLAADVAAFKRAGGKVERLGCEATGLRYLKPGNAGRWVRASAGGGKDRARIRREFG